MPKENLLKSIGLTEYEARAYVTLLKLGTATAERLSEAGNIPLPRVYDTIVELQRKGFVLIGKTRPKLFKPISVEKALSNYIDIQEKEKKIEIESMKKTAKGIEKDLSTIEKVNLTEQKFSIWSTERRRNVMKTLQEQEKKAKKEILIFAGDLSWLTENTIVFKNLVKKNILIRVIMERPGERGTMDIVRKAKRLGMMVKTGYLGDLRGQIIDSNIASIAVRTRTNGKSTKTDFPEDDIESNYELLVFENPGLVKTFKENFEFWWNKLK
jgi:sugar-specific transcriptional regulator TrmB